MCDRNCPFWINYACEYSDGSCYLNSLEYEDEQRSHAIGTLEDQYAELEEAYDDPHTTGEQRMRLQEEMDMLSRQLDDLQEEGVRRYERILA